MSDGSLSPSPRIQRRKYLFPGLIGVIILASALGLRSISFDNNVESMLPADEEVVRSIRFFRESDLSDKVFISLGIKSSGHSTKELIQAVDQLAASLRSPLVTEVMTGVSETEMLSEIDTLLTGFPQLASQKDLCRIDRLLTPQGVKDSLARDFQHLLTPASSFMVPFIRSDPLGIKARVLGNLRTLYTSLGYEVNLEDGHFISKDGRHALLILKTPVVLTDGFGSRKLHAFLLDRLKSLPDFVFADIVAGHLHSISNEDVLKRDVRIMTIIASVAFVLLFLLLFQDIRAIAVFVLPMAAVLVATSLSSMIFDKLSYLVIGMGGVVVGFVIDYGIYVYTAVIRTGDNSAAIVKKIAGPVLTGALTTVAIFIAFFFSHVQGYYQLAAFSIISITLCILGSFFILPHLLCAHHDSRLLAAVRRSSPIRQVAISDTRKILFGGVMIIAALLLCSRLTFDADIRQFDGSDRKISQTEEKFHHIWGGKDAPAVLVVPGENLEEALERNEQVYHQAAGRIGEDNISSLALLWPSRKTRQENANRWVRFWKQGREEKLRNLLSEYGQKYHFSKDAFSPFFESLYTGAIVGDFTPLQRLRDRFIMEGKEGKDGFRVLSFFPDKDHYLSSLKAICSRYPGTFVVSRKNLSQALSRSVFSETVYLSGIAAVLVAAITLLLLKSIRLSILALLPSVTGIAVALGIMPLMRLPLNAANIMAAMIVAGLTSDYGIFMVYACKYRLNTGTRTAISLSAITTLVGTAVLLFARHPVLFSIGLTLTAGVFPGFISSMMIVPALYAQWIKVEREPLPVCGL
ncbi:MAG: hypothetical protein AB1611_10160 [bacterium]